MSLVNEFVSEADIYAVGAGPIRELRDASGDTAYLTVLQDREIFVVFEATGLHPVQTRRPRLPGQICCMASPRERPSWPTCRTSGARRCSPQMPLTRFTPNTITTPRGAGRGTGRHPRQGYALDREEWLVGLACVAAPVFDRHGACVATASVAYPAVQAERRDELIELVEATAARISASLGYVEASAAAPSRQPQAASAGARARRGTCRAHDAGSPGNHRRGADRPVPRGGDRRRGGCLVAVADPDETRGAAAGGACRRGLSSPIRTTCSPIPACRRW